MICTMVRQVEILIRMPCFKGGKKAVNKKKDSTVDWEKPNATEQDGKFKAIEQRFQGSMYLVTKLFAANFKYSVH